MPANYKIEDKKINQTTRAEGAEKPTGQITQLLEEIAAIFLIGIAIFIIISLITYEGLNQEGLPDLALPTGIAGGYLSFILMTIWGLASYFLPFTIVFSALALLSNKKDILMPARILFSFLTMILQSALLHSLMPQKTVLGGHPAGGVIGSWLGGILLPVFGRTGSVIILLTSSICFLIFVTKVSAKKVFMLLIRLLSFTGSSILCIFRKLFHTIRNTDKRTNINDQPLPSTLESGLNREEDSPDKECEKNNNGKDSPDETKINRKRKEKPAYDSAGSFLDIPYKFPPLNLLKMPSDGENRLSKEMLKAVQQKLIDTLSSYGIKGEITAIHPGPVVTTYEFKPEKGTKISSITSREDDITMSLEAQKVRIVAPIPGKNAVGFEIPNPARSMVYLRELLQDPEFDRKRKKIPIAIGKDIIGRPFIGDLDKMPHLLIAGTTGSGKSVCINAMLTGLLYTFTPDELKLILVDPKQVEMQTYSGIPHLLLPVVADPKKAAIALKWAVDEMERRYQLFAISGSRDLISYNRKIASKKLYEKGTTSARRNDNESAEKPDSETNTPIKTETSQAETEDLLPYIIIIIDELADLMMAAVRDVEWAIIRLAQKARAAGIHLIMATQRPSVNVVTGLIKANFPCRIAFRVAAKIDSRVMLDTNGAETLLGDGDMLILPPGTSDLVRVQGAFISEDEITSVTDFLKKQRQVTYREDILNGKLDDEEISCEENEEQDEYYEKAVALVLSERKASVSYLQRRFSIGYNRAARIMEKMEKEGIVGPQIPGKPYREVIRTDS